MLKIDEELVFLSQNGVRSTLSDVKSRLSPLISNAQNIDKITWFKKSAYPSDYVLAKLAKDAYRDEYHDGFTDWIRLITAHNEGNGYFGVAYWNNGQQQLVIAHRGTKRTSAGALLADLEGIVRNQYTKQMNSASTFAANLVEILTDLNAKHVKVSFTGHSLGAWLAQITTFTTQYLKKKNSNFKKNQNLKDGYYAHTVVFDSPGSETILTKLKDGHYHRYAGPNLKKLDITIYLSAPNLVNTCNRHIGALYRIYLTSPEWSSLGEYFKYTSYTHSMKNIVEVFDSITEKARNTKMIENWPLVTWPSAAESSVAVGLPNFSLTRILRIIEATPGLIYDKFSGKLEDEEYKRFFNWANNKNQYGPEPEFKSSNGIILHYKTKPLQQHVSQINIFTQSEMDFLESWQFLKKEKINSQELNNFLTSNQLELIEELPNFNLYEEDGYKKISCNNPDSLAIVIRGVKQLLRWFPNVMLVMKKQISITPKMYEALYKGRSLDYLNSLMTHVQEINLKDTIELEKFLASDKQRVLHLSTTQLDTGLEAAKIYNILKTIKDNNLNKYTKDEHYTFSSWAQILGLENVLNIVEIVKSKSQIDNLLVIDYQDTELNEKGQNLLKRLFNSLQSQTTTNQLKKIIVITQKNNNAEIIQILKDSGIKYTETEIKGLVWEDLTLESQKIYLAKKIVAFQEQIEKRSLAELIGIDNLDNVAIEELKRIIDTGTLVKLIKGEEIEIGKAASRLSNSEAAYTKFYQDIIGKEKIRNLGNSLLNMLKNNEAIFMMSGIKPEEINNAERLVEYLGMKYKYQQGGIIRDAINSNMGNKKIIIYTGQNEEEEFKILCHSNDYRDKRIYWLEIISEQKLRLQQLYDPNFYFNRQFQYKDKIVIKKELKNELVKEEFSDSFIFNGLNNQQELIKLLNVSNEEERQFLCKIKLAASFSEAETIFQKLSEQNKPVHWLKVEEEQLVWQCSHGSLKVLRDHIDKDKSKQSPLDEEEFIKKISDKAVIIIDEPGMGKSITLTKLSEEGLKSNWVIRINLRDCQDAIKELPSRNIAVGDVVNFLSKVDNIGLDTSLAKGLVRYKLKHATGGKSLLLLFDGFDEIKDKSKEDKGKEKVSSLLKFLKDNTTVWVTARKHETEILQDSLSIFDTQFKEFKRQEQKEFFKEFWKIRISLTLSQDKFKMFGAKFELYSEALFDRIDEVLRKENARFMGIPLQLQLLAGGFQNEFVVFIRGSDVTPDFSELNILNIYQHFIDAKYNVYFKEKTKLAIGLSSVSEGWLKKESTKEHWRLAFKQIFGDRAKEFLEIKSPFSGVDEEGKLELDDDQLKELLRIGMIQSTGRDHFEFIHQTFAEYYVVELLMNWLKRPAEHHRNLQVREFLLTEILLKPDYQAIRAFLNSQLAKEKLSSDVLKGYGKEIKKLWSNKNLINNDKFTILHIAAIESNGEIVGFVLNSLSLQEDLDTLSDMVVAKDKDGKIALHWAADKGNFDVVKWLIEKGADLNAKTKDDKTVLHEAAGKGNLDVVKWLIEKGANVNAKGDQYGDTVLHLAAASGNLDVVKWLVEKDAKVDAKNKDSTTALHRAADKGNLDMVKWLVGKGANVNATNKFGKTVLHEAASSGNFELVKWLVERGADVNAKAGKWTVLHRAAQSNNWKVVKFLVEKDAKVNAKGNVYGDTVLHKATDMGNLDMVKWLIEKDADVNATDDFGRTVLHKAADMGNLDMVKWLIEHGEADVNVNAKDNDGKTVLHWAADKGKWKVAKWLVEHGKADVKATDNDGKTPLDLAQEKLAKKTTNQEKVKTIITLLLSAMNKLDLQSEHLSHLQVESYKEQQKVQYQDHLCPLCQRKK